MPTNQRLRTLAGGEDPTPPAVDEEFGIPAAEPGAPVEEAVFTFVVEGVTCDQQPLQSDFSAEPVVPKGQFCAVSLTVTNSSDFPAVFGTSGNVFLYDSEGRQFASDSNATLEAFYEDTAGGETGIGQELNPEQSAEGRIVCAWPCESPR